MSTFPVNYYDPNQTNYVSTIVVTAISKNLNNICTIANNNIDCTEVSGTNALTDNRELADKIQKASKKNSTTLGFYNDSSIFYTTQYIQLWNMAGGIALSGFLIYYLINKQK